MISRHKGCQLLVIEPLHCGYSSILKERFFGTPCSCSANLTITIFCSCSSNTSVRVQCKSHTKALYKVQRSASAEGQTTKEPRKSETQLINSCELLWPVQLWRCFLCVIELGLSNELPSLSWIGNPSFLSFDQLSFFWLIFQNFHKEQEGEEREKKVNTKDGQKFFSCDWPSWWRLSGEFFFF